jgi:hypothetical protein
VPLYRCVPLGGRDGLGGEDVVSELAGQASAVDEQPAFEVALQSESGEVGAADEGGLSIYDKDLGVHRRTGRPRRQRPAQVPCGESREGIRAAGEAGLSTLRSSSR